MLALAVAFEASAGLVLDPPAGADEPVFRERLRKVLAELAQSTDPSLRRLYETAVASPATIHVRPMTGHRSTWNADGTRTRGHTDPDDKRSSSHTGAALRTSYHGKFPTLDYQVAVRRGVLAEYVRDIFTRSGFPPGRD